MDNGIGVVLSGTPSASFMPAREYKFKDKGDIVSIPVPKSGKFPEGSFDGGFDISPVQGTVAFGDLLKVMFAMSLYPDLKDNERFVIYTVEVSTDVVNVVGRVIEFLE